MKRPLLNALMGVLALTLNPGVSPALAQTLDAPGCSTVHSGNEIYRICPSSPPIGAVALRQLLIGSWAVRIGNPDRQPEAATHIAQIFRQDGTGVIVPYENSRCGATPIRSFKWNTEKGEVHITDVNPASYKDGEFIIGPQQRMESPPVAHNARIAFDYKANVRFAPIADIRARGFR
jgi:hypothetical protein